MKSGTVCIVTMPEASALRSTLPLARFFQEKGYQIEYAGLFDEKAIQYLATQGYKCNSFLNGEYYSDIFSNKIDGKASRGDQILCYTNQIAQKQELLNKCYSHYKNSLPTLVLFERTNASWIIPFLKLGVPVLAFSITLGTHINSCVPSVFSNFVPSKNALRNTVLIMRYWVSMYLREALYLSVHRLKRRRLFGLSRIPTINTGKDFKRARLGTLWGDYGLALNVPTIYFCFKEFDFPNGLKHRLYAGTSIEFNRIEKPFSWHGVDTNRKNIYLTLGSLAGNLDRKVRRMFYSMIINIVSDSDEYNLLLQVPDISDLEDIAIPSNVHVYSWVPHTEIFQKVSIVICHAGLATLREAMYFGIPVVVFPWKGDQFGNAARVVYHNLGLRGDLTKVTPQVLKSLISRASADESIHAAVNEFQEYAREQKDFCFDISFFEKYIKQWVTDRGKTLVGDSTPSVNV